MSTAKVDGRLGRSVRTREKIIGALFHLVGEGILKPRAEEIAKQADVAVRTLFRHFDDMEGLLGAARAYLSVRFDAPPDQPLVEGSLEERVRSYTERQGALFDEIRNYLLFYATNGRTVEDVNELGAHAAQAQRLRIWTALPECAAANSVAQHAVEAHLSFQNWDHLRFEQGLSAEKAVEAITWSTLTLLRAGARNLEG